MTITKRDRNGVARLVECGWKPHDIIRAAQNDAANRGESFTDEDKVEIMKLIQANRSHEEADATAEDLF